MLKKYFKGFIVCLTVLVSISGLYSQNPPDSLKIIGSAGGMLPWSETVTIQITADGTGKYTLSDHSNQSQPIKEEHLFSLTQDDINRIWQAVQDNDFFNLYDRWVTDLIKDRTYAFLSVSTGSTVHSVYSQNMAVPRLDSILTVINEVTPDDLDLIYDTSQPPQFTFIDPFDSGFGKQANRETFENYPLIGEDQFVKPLHKFKYGKHSIKIVHPYSDPVNLCNKFLFAPNGRLCLNKIEQYEDL